MSDQTIAGSQPNGYILVRRQPTPALTAHIPAWYVPLLSSAPSANPQTSSPSDSAKKTQEIHVVLDKPSPGFSPWVVPAVSLLAALFVSVANFSIQRWRFNVDRLNAAVDQLSSEINATADLSLEYWMLDCSNPDEQKRAHLLESQLIGRQTRIQNLVLALQKQDARLNFTEVNVLITQLYEAISGGAFQTRGRSPDVGKGREVQTSAALLSGMLRRLANLRARRIT